MLLVWYSDGQIGVKEGIYLLLSNYYICIWCELREGVFYNA
jgi:hypothetical protein